MDMRTGKLYGTEAEAIAEAFDPTQVAPVDVETSSEGPIIRVKNGPFAGRVYRVRDGKRGERLKHLETKS